MQYGYQDIFMWRLNSGNYQFEQAQFMILGQLARLPAGNSFDDSAIIGAAGNPALTALTLLMVVAAAYLASQPSDDAIADATSDAEGAAERGMVTILAYDYRTLDEDQEAAGELMTQLSELSNFHFCFPVAASSA